MGTCLDNCSQLQTYRSLASWLLSKISSRCQLPAGDISSFSLKNQVLCLQSTPKLIGKSFTYSTVWYHYVKAWLDLFSPFRGVEHFSYVQTYLPSAEWMNARFEIHSRLPTLSIVCKKTSMTSLVLTRFNKKDILRSALRFESIFGISGWRSS